jgi:hypothetical protein
MRYFCSQKIGLAAELSLDPCLAQGAKPVRLILFVAIRAEIWERSWQEPALFLEG